MAGSLAPKAACEMTFLYQVVVNRDAEMSYLLLRAGAEVNAYDKAGKTPLTYGLQCQDLPACRVLKHFNGMITLERYSMARNLAKNTGVDIERAMSVLQDRNIHIVSKLGGGSPVTMKRCNESDATEGEERKQTRT